MAAATCIGELCFNSLFSIWYDKRPAREVVVGALLLNTFACIAYATAPHHFFVLISRFIAGAAAGVQAPLMTMVGAFTNRYNRAEILGTVRSTYLLAFILGAGFSTSVTFVHMVNPGLPLDSMEYSVPHYVRESKTAVKDEVDSATKGTKVMIIPHTQQSTSLTILILGHHTECDVGCSCGCKQSVRQRRQRHTSNELASSFPLHGQRRRS